VEGVVKRIARPDRAARDRQAGERALVERGQQFERAPRIVAARERARVGIQMAMKAASCAVCVEPTSGGKLCHACVRLLPSSWAVGAGVKRQLSRV
jgi:hypothetical protein